MTIELLLELAWKSVACASLTLLALRLMRSRSAAEKAFIAHMGLLTMLLVPLGSALLPNLKVTAPAQIAQMYDRGAPAAAGSLEALAAAPSLAAAGDDLDLMRWLDTLAYLCTIPAAILLLLTLVAVARLRRLRARAEVLVDPCWLTALASAQRRLALKHGTALLASDEINSPISWGIVRPVVIVDRALVKRADRAEAIIAHELAHVARLDWPALLLGRAVCAIFWFNPLVWMLARQAHEFSEEAADDAVLRAQVPGVEYAEILVGAARHATRPLMLAANGVAPGSGSLGRRVVSVLDPTRSRIPVRAGWFALCLAGALSFGTALAAVEPKLSAEPTGPQGSFGRLASARLAAIPLPQTRAIATAIERQDWDARRSRGSTLFRDERAVEPLILALRDTSPVTRRIAAWGLSELRPPEAVGPLRPLLHDDVPEVRAEAARALGDLGAGAEAEAIARLLRDPDAHVRLQAAHALGDLQNPAARPALEAALRDGDAGVRAKAAWALRQVAEAEAVLQKYGGG